MDGAIVAKLASKNSYAQCPSICGSGWFVFLLIFPLSLVNMCAAIKHLVLYEVRSVIRFLLARNYLNQLKSHANFVKFMGIMTECRVRQRFNDFKNGCVNIHEGTRSG